MRTKLLAVLFLFFGLIPVSNAQATKYGMLVRTTLDPFQGWSGSHAGNLSVTVGSKSVNKGSNTTSNTVVAYAFFYVTDNPNQIVCSSSTAGNRDGGDCNQDKIINYDRNTFNSDYFGGCIGDADIMGIYLAQPTNTNYCKNDVITLTRGWNWQYRYDGGTWGDFPSTYQSKRSISFNMEALGGSDGKQKLQIRTGYGTSFTDEIILDIIPCPPGLVGTPLTTSTSCVNKSDGTLILTYDRPLVANESFAFSFFRAEGMSAAVPPYVVDNVNKTINFTDIAAGSYYLKYQTFVGAQQTSVNPSPDPTFTIPPATPVSFQVEDLQPQCNGQQGKIKITASGGTGFFFYKIDTDPEVAFTSPSGEINISTGQHSIKVRDSKSCIDLDKNE